MLRGTVCDVGDYVLLLCMCCLYVCAFFFFNDTATTEIYTLSLHDALPILGHQDEDLALSHQDEDLTLSHRDEDPALSHRDEEEVALGDLLTMGIAILGVKGRLRRKLEMC